MRVTREQMADNRLRILDAASALFREKGFDAVTVAEVMKAAGLTHGGFYGHFSSKDDLVAKTLDHAFQVDPDSKFELKSYVARYLSGPHRDNPGQGCPTAGLVAETRHQGAAARSVMTDGTRAQIERMSAGFKGEAADQHRLAIVSWAAMVGAVILARGIDDPLLSEEVLTQTRAFVEEHLSA